MKKRTRVIALFLSLSLILPGMAQGIPTVAKAESESLVPSGPAKNENGIMTWDCVYFGKYWQRDTNKDGAVDQKDAKEPIKWRVLSVEGNDTFLMADQPLDCRKYSGNQNDFNIDVDYEPELSATWEDCSLRTWLNETFYQDAFSQEEGEAIQTVTVTNEDNPITGIDGGNNTEDKVYLLSLSEAATAAYGFSTNSWESVSRVAEGTKYAENNDTMDFDLDSYWWLRSPGALQTHAVIISPLGQVGTNGMPVDYAPLGVRPVLHIDLSASSVWKSAGTVTGTEPAMPSGEPTATTAPTGTTKPTATTKPTSKPVPTTTMQPGEKKAISSFKDLQAMEDIPSGDYYLANDITVPVNTQLFQDYPFTGTLDGKGYKINGYKVQKKYVFSEKITHVTLDAGVNDDNEDMFSEPALVGLFCRASGATFQNLSLTNVDINVQTEAYATVGALVREAAGCKFNNIHVSGKISVQSIRENPLEGPGFVVGGITGSSYGTMTNCSNSASISVNCKNGEYAGGVSVGGLSGTYVDNITKCSNSGNISVIGYCGDQQSMGVAGLVPKAKSITSCKNSGNVSLKVQGGKGNKYEIPNDSDNACHEIFILDAKAAGIAVNTDNIKSSGNTGKISLDYPLTFSIKPTQFLSGVVCKVINKAQGCYNKGTVSFSGNAAGFDTEEGDGSVIAGLFVNCNRVRECYNTGQVTAQNNKKGNSFVIAGVVAMSTAYMNCEIRNCYNTGKISLKGKGKGIAGGVVGYYEGDKTGKTRMRYNYNVGKITVTQNSLKGSILGEQDQDSADLSRKTLVHDNYYKGSVKAYNFGFQGKLKKYEPKAKKVSSITRAKCPKLSSKYWVYSSKVKRLILKNNKETKLGIKTKKK